MLTTGSIQEDPSKYDLTIVDWDVKNQNNHRRLVLDTLKNPTKQTKKKQKKNPKQAPSFRDKNWLNLKP